MTKKDKSSITDNQNVYNRNIIIPSTKTDINLSNISSNLNNTISPPKTYLNNYYKPNQILPFNKYNIKTSPSKVRINLNDISNLKSDINNRNIIIPSLKVDISNDYKTVPITDLSNRDNRQSPQKTYAPSKTRKKQRI